MKKNDVLNIVIEAVKSKAIECSRVGETKNKQFLFIRDTDVKGFLVTVEDETSGTPSLQDIKTSMHQSVCQDLISLHKRNLHDDGDEFGRKCTLADNRARVIAGYLAPTLEILEGYVLTDAHGTTGAEARRTIFHTVESLAYYAIAGLVELGNVSSKETGFEGLCGELNALYDKKNRDYDDAFAKSLDKYGPTVLCIRLSDKLNRFNALAVDCKEQSVDDESVFDTLKDFSNYAILTLVEMRLDPGNSEVSDAQRRLAEYEATGLQPDECKQLMNAVLSGQLKYSRGRALPFAADTPAWLMTLLTRKVHQETDADTGCRDWTKAGWIDMNGKTAWGCDMSHCTEDPEDNRYE